MLSVLSWLKGGGDKEADPGSSASETSEAGAALQRDSRTKRRGSKVSPQHPTVRSSSATSSERTLVDAIEYGKFGNSEGVSRPDHMSIPELYYQCQNLSYYPYAPPLARRFLLSFISRYINEESVQALRRDNDCIFSLSPDFDENALDAYLRREYRNTTDKFESYLQRRRTEGDREMFSDREDATRWCKQSAVSLGATINSIQLNILEQVVKYVDGSWIQSTYQTTSGLETQRAAHPYSVSAARKASRVSWQVLSEELGDGDIEKEHCAVYERLMDSLANETTPKADEEAFEAWNKLPGHDEVDNKQPYVAAMLQLAMSISPNEFMPEILGFNLSYEGLPYHLLVTSHELKELRIDPYYFVLHISIDNSHSGHSAMAKLAVVDFIKSVAQSHGKEAANIMWKRVQSGYVLADSVRTTPRSSREMREGPAPVPEQWIDGIPLAKDDFLTADAMSRQEAEDKLLQIFRAKAFAAQGLHCTAPARIGGKRIGEWLTPENLAGESGCEFMQVLSESKIWVRRGEGAEKSRLIRECEWGGRMFGAFTTGEVETMKTWARSLPLEDGLAKDALPARTDLNASLASPYALFLGHSDKEYFEEAIRPMDFSARLQDVRTFDNWLRAAPQVYQKCLDHAHGVRGAFQLDINTWLEDVFGPVGTPSADFVDELVATAPRLQVSSDDAKTSLLPTLFISSALLEWMPAAGPVKLAGPLGMAAVKIQRALYGFSSAESEDETCCSGIDDIMNVKAGIWEYAAALFEDGSQMTLDTFMDFEDRAVALPALVLLLNTQPTLHLPILLGIQLALNVYFHEPLAQGQIVESEDWRRNMSELVQQSRYWIMEAIALGSSQADNRGWEGDGDWNHNVMLGWKAGETCLTGAVSK